MLKTIVLVGAGGMVGAVSRFIVISLASHFVSTTWSVFFVNVAGCLAVGALVGWLMGSQWFEATGRAFLVVGFLGSFTTFSAFSLDVIGLFQTFKYLEGLMYLLLTTSMCVLATWLGLRLASVPC